MFEIIIKKISNKIIIALFLLMSFSSLTVILVTTSKVTEDSIAKTKENLEMLNTAMFQSLRNAMNTGVPEQIAKAEDDANQKEFEGKNEVKAKNAGIKKEVKEHIIVSTPKKIVKTSDSSKPKPIVNQTQEIKSNSNDDEWESF